MREQPAIELTEEFDIAFAELSAARASYEDQPRDPDRIEALGQARARLDDARSAIADERHRLGLESPWRVEPAKVATTKAPPTWSVDHGAGA